MQGKTTCSLVPLTCQNSEQKRELHVHISVQVQPDVLLLPCIRKDDGFNRLLKLPLLDHGAERGSLLGPVRTASCQLINSSRGSFTITLLLEEEGAVVAARCVPALTASCQLIHLR